MIKSISADKKSFKTIEFTTGFNVILAERTKKSSKKDSRNGLGKSTLIEIIHFCLGGSKGETLSKNAMDDWTFTIKVAINGADYSISRNTLKSKLGKIYVAGDFSAWPIRPDLDKKTELHCYSKNDWNKLLGAAIFGLPMSSEEMKYQPSFRSLISYFIRRNGQSGAFLTPFNHYKKQTEWDSQINNAFLLDLDWEYASKLQVLKDRKKVIDQIKTATQSGLLSHLVGSVGELEALMIRLEAQIKQESEQLASFRVHPQYASVESEANELTRKIHELSNDDITDKNLLNHYEASIADEIDAKTESITKLYEEAGVHFPTNITKQIDDVLNFHKQVIINRKDFLESEIGRLKSAIVTRDQQKAELSIKRSELMRILSEHGALEEYTKLQNRNQKTIAEFQNIKLKAEGLKKFEQGKSSLAIDRELLFQEAKVEISQRQRQKEAATLRFNENSKSLYDVPGTLSIDIEKTGYKFGVTIERSGSHGIGNMKIFCYDLLLAILWAKKKSGPKLLVHDSILFDGVDERQKALAIELAMRESEQLGFQYIFTLNSDSLPSTDFSRDFDIQKYVRQTLTDATDDGGLLGIRF